MSKKPIDHFADAMRRESVQAALVRTGVDVQKFVMDAIQLIEGNPNLLSVDDPESLIAAFIECAAYGFYPNGDEGYFEVRNNKIAENTWRRSAAYELTTAGIRSIAKRHDVLINANIVHRNDIFRHEEGDNPTIDHVIEWGSPDGRGEPYLVYAIFKHKDGTILHREVMDEAMIDAVSNKSRNKKGMLWNEFWTEGWKKSVIRRGSKTVKLSAEVQKAACQVDRDYSFGKTDEPAAPSPDKKVVEVNPTKSTNSDETLPENIQDADAVEVKAPKRRGRPPGSKNKPKPTPKAAREAIAKAKPDPVQPYDHSEPVREMLENPEGTGKKDVSGPVTKKEKEKQEVEKVNTAADAKTDEIAVSNQSTMDVDGMTDDQFEDYWSTVADAIELAESQETLAAAWDRHAEFIDNGGDDDGVLKGMYESKLADLV